MNTRGAMANRPFVVVERHPDAPSRLAATTIREALALARANGWIVLRGWAAPMRRDRIVCTGWIRSPDDARRALLAAVAGARLAVGISTDRDTVDRFLDDLRRLGPIDHVEVETVAAEPLDARQRALLALLSEGLTVSEAALELGIARQTASRLDTDP